MHRQAQGTWTLLDHELALRRVGVAHHVGDRLRGDAKRRHFDRCGQRRQRLSPDSQPDSCAVGEPREHLGECVDEAELVECRRA